MTIISPTKNYGFWIAAESDDPRAIVHSEIVSAKTNNDDVDLEEYEPDFKSWLPVAYAQYSEYNSDIEDLIYSMKTASRNPDNIDEIYEKCIGPRWDPEMQEIMSSLSMKKITYDPDDYLSQEVVESLPGMRGWKVKSWIARFEEIEGIEDKLVCDEIVWEKTFEINTLITVVSKQGWAPYPKVE